MNINDYKTILKHSYEIKRPVYCHSAPGCGKSSAVQQVAEELSIDYDVPFGVIEVRGASSSPAELADIKYVSKDTVCEASQKWLPTNDKANWGDCPARGVIFCDELTDSMKSVQSTLQRLFLDRKLGSLTLADGWMVTSAGNRVKDKAATSGQVSRALLNRCISVSVEPDVEEFYTHGLNIGIDYRILAFVRFRPNAIMDCLTTHKGDNQAFCSPRSLHITSDSLKAKHSLPEALRMEAITGILGDGVGSEVNGFLRVMDDLPDLADLLNNPKTYGISHKIDVLWATIGALVARVNKQNLTAIMQYFIRLPPEMATVAIMDLTKVHKGAYNTPEFAEFAVNNVNLMSGVKR